MTDPYAKYKARQKKWKYTGKVKKTTTRRSTITAVKRILDKNSEFKHTTVNSTLTITSTLQQTNLLTAIEEGNDYGNRNGRRINVRKIQLQGYFLIADTTNMCRVLVLQELENSATLTSDLFTGTPSVTSLRNPEMINKYRVLWDKVVSLTAVSRPQTGMVSLFKKCNIDVRYNGTTGSPCHNNIFIAYVSDSGSVTHPTFIYTSRIYFTDL